MHGGAYTVAIVTPTDEELTFWSLSPHSIKRRSSARLCLRDWSRSGGSYGNNTWVICCPAPGRPHQTTNHEGVVAVTPDWPWSIPIITWLNKLYYMYLRQNTFKITTKSSDVAYLPPLWRHASLLNDGSCSFTHPVAKGRSARGTSPGT